MAWRRLWRSTRRGAADAGRYIIDNIALQPLLRRPKDRGEGDDGGGAAPMVVTWDGDGVVRAERGCAFAAAGPPVEAGTPLVAASGVAGALGAGGCMACGRVGRWLSRRWPAKQWAGRPTSPVWSLGTSSGRRGRGGRRGSRQHPPRGMGDMFGMRGIGSIVRVWRP